MHSGECSLQCLQHWETHLIGFSSCTESSKHPQLLAFLWTWGDFLRGIGEMSWWHQGGGVNWGASFLGPEDKGFLILPLVISQKHFSCKERKRSREMAVKNRSSPGNKDVLNNIQNYANVL